MAEPISYHEAIKQTEDKGRSLLLGNGFSIKYFSYRNLLEATRLEAGDALLAIFKALDTVDFESVIRALEIAAIVERAYRNEKQHAQLVADAVRLRNILIGAVRQTHPSHRENIADVIPYCLAFLKEFQTIFTLNYDLLLYWVILDAADSFGDGFGLGQEENGFRGPFQTNAHCNIYNVHGGLHLFRTATGDVEKRLMGAKGIIDAIADTIARDKRLPIYVAEGTSVAKLNRINSTPYLRHGYDRLAASSGYFFVFGHSAAENDAHIYDALFKSKIKHLYFCIHKPTAKIEQIDGELARYKKRNRSRIEYTFVDSQTMHIWDKPA
jgi:Domain of unknown function (DUF4917)